MAVPGMFAELGVNIEPLLEGLARANSAVSAFSEEALAKLNIAPNFIGLGDAGNRMDQLGRRMGQLTGYTGSLNRALDRLGGTFSAGIGIGATLGGIVSLTRAFEIGIKKAQEFQTGLISIASSRTTNIAYQNASTGTWYSGPKATPENRQLGFMRAQADSERINQEIIRRSNINMLTYAEQLAAYQKGIGFAARKGINDKDIMDVTELAAIRAKQLGVQGNQIANQVRILFTGQNSPRSIVGSDLQIDPKLVKKLTGKELVDYFKNKLSGVEAAEPFSAKSLQAKVTTAQSGIEQMMGRTVQNVFSNPEISGGMDTLVKSFMSGTSTLEKNLTSLFTNILKAIKNVAESPAMKVIQGFFSFLAEHASQVIEFVAFQRLLGLLSALRTGATGAMTAIGRLFGISALGSPQGKSEVNAKTWAEVNGYTRAKGDHTPTSDYKDEGIQFIRDNKGQLNISEEAQVAASKTPLSSYIKTSGAEQARASERESYVQEHGLLRQEGLLASVQAEIESTAGAGRKYGPLKRELQDAIASETIHPSVRAELEDMWLSQNPATKARRQQMGAVTEEATSTPVSSYIGARETFVAPSGETLPMYAHLNLSDKRVRKEPSLGERLQGRYNEFRNIKNAETGALEYTPVSAAYSALGSQINPKAFLDEEGVPLPKEARLGRFNAGFNKFLGVGSNALMAGFMGQMGGSYLDSATGRDDNMFQNVLGGAATGGALGSIIPVFGTALGAAVGAITAFTHTLIDSANKVAATAEEKYQRQLKESGPLNTERTRNQELIQKLEDRRHYLEVDEKHPFLKPGDKPFAGNLLSSAHPGMLSQEEQDLVTKFGGGNRQKAIEALNKRNVELVKADAARAVIQPILTTLDEREKMAGQQIKLDQIGVGPQNSVKLLEDKAQQERIAVLQAKARYRPRDETNPEDLPTHKNEKTGEDEANPDYDPSRWVPVDERGLNRAIDLRLKQGKKVLALQKELQAATISGDPFKVASIKINEDLEAHRAENYDDTAAGNKKFERDRQTLQNKSFREYSLNYAGQREESLGERGSYQAGAIKISQEMEANRGLYRGDTAAFNSDAASRQATWLDDFKKKIIDATSAVSDAKFAVINAIGALNDFQYSVRSGQERADIGVREAKYSALIAPSQMAPKLLGRSVQRAEERAGNKAAKEYLDEHYGGHGAEQRKAYTQDVERKAYQHDKDSMREGELNVGDKMHEAATYADKAAVKLKELTLAVDKSQESYKRSQQGLNKLTDSFNAGAAAIYAAISKFGAYSPVSPAPPPSVPAPQSKAWWDKSGSTQETPWWHKNEKAAKPAENNATNRWWDLAPQPKAVENTSIYDKLKSLGLAGPSLRKNGENPAFKKLQSLEPDDTLYALAPGAEGGGTVTSLSSHAHAIDATPFKETPVLSAGQTIMEAVEAAQKRLKNEARPDLGKAAPDGFAVYGSRRWNVEQATTTKDLATLAEWVNAHKKDTVIESSFHESGNGGSVSTRTTSRKTFSDEEATQRLAHNMSPDFDATLRKRELDDYLKQQVDTYKTVHAAHDSLPHKVYTESGAEATPLTTSTHWLDVLRANQSQSLEGSLNNMSHVKESSQPPKTQELYVPDVKNRIQNLHSLGGSEAVYSSPGTPATAKEHAKITVGGEVSLSGAAGFVAGLTKAISAAVFEAVAKSNRNIQARGNA